MNKCFGSFPLPSTLRQLCGCTLFASPVARAIRISVMSRALKVGDA